MNLTLVVTAAAVISGLLSLVGGVFFLLNKRFQNLDLKYLISFAAGTMLAAALLDVIPEALAIGNAEIVSKMVLCGIVAFFIGEKTLLWHHHSHNHKEEHIKPVGPLVIVGDTIHNFLDGVVIGITFSLDYKLGIITTLAIIAHEIPQELGDFAILLNAGVDKAKVFTVNIISSMAAVLGAWLAISIQGTITQYMPYLLGFAAGNFIYIAAADLIPEIHHEKNTWKMLIQIICLVLGVTIVGYIITLVE